jgi:putative acyl-CoA dehydrogenase
VAEALECIGGNGYVEESPLPRLYRDVPLNSLWEGPGNVQCLDVLRALHKDPETMTAVLQELTAAQGGFGPFDDFVKKLETELRDPSELEMRARRVVEDLALALQGAILVQHAPSAVAYAFCISRLTGDRRLALGTLPAGTDFDTLIERSRPKLSD